MPPRQAGRASNRWPVGSARRFVQGGWPRRNPPLRRPLYTESDRARGHAAADGEAVPAPVEAGIFRREQPYAHESAASTGRGPPGWFALRGSMTSQHRRAKDRGAWQRLSAMRPGPCLYLLALASLPPHGAPSLTGRAWGQPHFVESSAAAGLGGFRLHSGDRHKRYIVEANSAGVCVIDYDLDGRPDLYLVNGGRLEEVPGGSPLAVAARAVPQSGRAPLQGCHPGSGRRRERPLGHGVFGNRLQRRRFSRPLHHLVRAEPTAEQSGRRRLRGTSPRRAGVDDSRWSTGSAWADVDLDGDLDLFVANYIKLDPGNLPEPGSPAFGSMGSPGLGCQYMGLPVMCGPRGLPGAGDSLFLNRGDGSFEDVSVASGLSDPQGYFGLGTLFSDLDDDGLPELFVANDSTPNLLYKNLGNGRFEEVGPSLGTGLQRHGVEQAGMGVAGRGFPQPGPSLALRHALLRGVQHPLPQRGRPELLRCHGGGGSRPPHASVRRLGHDLAGLRQRRLAGHLRGQRTCLPNVDQLQQASVAPVPSTKPAFPELGQRPLPGTARLRARRARTIQPRGGGRRLRRRRQAGPDPQQHRLRPGAFLER